MHLRFAAPQPAFERPIRAADKAGASRAVILGTDEMAKRVATVREMGTGEQREVALDGLVSELKP